MRGKSVLKAHKREAASSGDALRVGLYISLLNSKLAECEALISGEITSISQRDTYLFFTLKDKIDGSLLQCFMWKRDYDFSGVSLEEGMEVAAQGVPEIYRARGSFSFRVNGLSLLGEGALKKAYDELKEKLTREGLFATSKKKELSEFPERIGLIASGTGAVIHDFLSNLGKHGFQISFYDVHVEGQYALREILGGIEYFQKKNIDTLVIIRGGGSLEVLQPFNTEAMVRAIAHFPKPVVCGIGHDKDVPLASLAADYSVSTPSMVTELLNRNWIHTRSRLALLQKEIFHSFEAQLTPFLNADHFQFIQSRFSSDLSSFSSSLQSIDRLIVQNDPQRQMKLGWSITRQDGRIVRRGKDVVVGKPIAVELSDGTIEAETKRYEKR